MEPTTMTIDQKIQLLSVLQAMRPYDHRITPSKFNEFADRIDKKILEIVESIHVRQIDEKLPSPPVVGPRF